MNEPTPARRRALFLAIAPVVAAALMLPVPAGANGKGEDDDDLFCLTVLHNNDAESQLVSAPGQPEFGGAALFATKVRQLRRAFRRSAEGCDLEVVDGSGDRRWAKWRKRNKVSVKPGVVTLSSGDNFLAGPEFTASLERGIPYYDSLLIKRIGYDALAIGNHEFDFGPDVLAELIRGIPGRNPPFLSANLDVSGEPSLARLERRGLIAPSVLIKERGRRIGIVGATTPGLPDISSPRNVVVNDVLPAVQGQIDRLTHRGADIIILISHLQGVNEDLQLIPLLRGVDIAIAGGGDELLLNGGELLVPGDETATPFGPYPLTAVNADGDPVPVVTTAGDLEYVGALHVLFDGDGNALSARGGLQRVAGGDAPDAVRPDFFMQRLVVEPVEAFTEGLAANVIGVSEVALNGVRAGGIRTQETNLGNLVADALLWQADRLFADFGAPPPTVGIQNGGGIRNNNVIPAGDITELTTFDILPFSNFVSIVPGIGPEQFKDIMENAVSRVEFVDGRFPQIAGFRLVYDPAGAPRVVEDDGTVTPGSRVVSITLDDGTPIVAAGAVVAGAPAVNVATIDFLARGGDQYPYGGIAFTSVGVSYQQALFNYIVDELGGVISAAEYPEASAPGEERIATVAP